MEEEKSTSVYAIIAGVLFAVLALRYLRYELQWMSDEYYYFSVYDICRWLDVIAYTALAVLLLLRKRGSYVIAPFALLTLTWLIRFVLFVQERVLDLVRYHWWSLFDLFYALLELMIVLSFAGMLLLSAVNFTKAFSGRRKALNSLWFVPAVLLAIQVVLEAIFWAICFYFSINYTYLLTAIAFLMAGLWIAYPEGLPKKAAAAAPVGNAETTNVTEGANSMETANTTETTNATETTSAASTAAGATAVTNEAYCGLVKHILLLLFTCGIWHYIWIYRMTRYTDGVEGEESRTPTNQLLLCLFVPFYIVYWMYKTAQRVDKMAAAKGISSDLSMLCLILEIFVIIVPPVLLQDKMNAIVTAGDAQPVAAKAAAAQGSAAKENTLGTAEELKTYKELLDSGVISQEEFEAKKRQLLGL